MREFTVEWDPGIRKVCGGYAELDTQFTSYAKLNVRKWRRCVEKPSFAGEATVRVGEARLEVTFPVLVAVSGRGDARADGKASFV